MRLALKVLIPAPHRPLAALLLRYPCLAETYGNRLLATLNDRAALRTGVKLAGGKLPHLLLDSGAALRDWHRVYAPAGNVASAAVVSLSMPFTMASAASISA